MNDPYIVFQGGTPLADLMMPKQETDEFCFIAAAWMIVDEDGYFYDGCEYRRARSKCTSEQITAWEKEKGQTK
jgi:hypothetical protein